MIKITEKIRLEYLMNLDEFFKMTEKEFQERLVSDALNGKAKATVLSEDSKGKIKMSFEYPEHNKE
jgi:hypothetical protein